jgi:hypothetical protein
MILGVLYGRQVTSVFMHVKQLWLTFPINKTISKREELSLRLHPI